MTKDARIKALAHQAAVKIKALSEAHQSQIEGIYRDFQEQAATIRGGNADELDNPSATPDTPSTKKQD